MNVYYRKDGRWEGRISKKCSNNGKKGYYYFFGNTRENVIAKMEDFEKRNLNNLSCTKTFNELYEEWLDHTLHSIKESTAENYKMKARLHLIPIFGDNLVSNISIKDIDDFIKVKENSGLSVRYICDILTLLKTILKYGSQIYDYKNPAARVCMPKKRKTQIQLLDTDQQSKLCKYLNENSNLTSLGVKLALGAGLRIGEVCALRWKDIDLNKRILTVNSTLQRIHCDNTDRKTKLIITEPKSESSIRQIPISINLANFLKQHLRDGNCYIISGTQKPIEPRTLQYRFNTILKNAELPSIHFHALRHMFATNCIRLGFDVKTLSELLGHSKVEITLNRYVHSSIERKKEFMEKVII